MRDRNGIDLSVGIEIDFFLRRVEIDFVVADNRLVFMYGAK